MLDMPRIEIIRRPRRSADGRKSQRGDDIAADAVVLVDRLGVVDAAVQAGRVVLREADDGLDVEQNVECQTEDGVRGCKVLVPRAGFVDLDDDQAGGQRGGAKEVEEQVGKCARALLIGGVGGLEDEGGLDGEEEAGRVEELEDEVSDGGRSRALVGPTGWAEKKTSFCERMAPQTMAASCDMLALSSTALPSGRAYNPDASLRHSCCA